MPPLVYWRFVQKFYSNLSMEIIGQPTMERNTHKQVPNVAQGLARKADVYKRQVYLNAVT